jgi:phospholipid-binding lipoprotein MlaA
MKKVSLLFIISVFCLALNPCFSSAQDTGDAPPQAVQTELQDNSEVPPPQTVQTELQDNTEVPSPPDVQTELKDNTEDPPLQDPTNGEQKADTVAAEPSPQIDETGSAPEDVEDNSESVESHGAISDPLEPINRVFFGFNDKLYYWFYKPVAGVYNKIAPEPVRVGFQNFFLNVLFPVRFVNSLLQAKFTGAGNEIGRFFINTTLGLAGFIDIAGKKFGIKPSDEDFGQTLAFYGLGQGIYINWPLLGPSSAVDTVGLAGDFFLDPGYYFLDFNSGVAEKSFKTFNDSSLVLADYQNLKDSALDPYIAVRDAYIQYRHNKIGK